jgi:hypothetical protein
MAQVKSLSKPDDLRAAQAALSSREWGRARTAFEDALRLGESPEAYEGLGLGFLIEGNLYGTGGGSHEIVLQVNTFPFLGGFKKVSRIWGIPR